jgi:hypothetical protein
MCVDVTEGDKMNIRPIDANALKRYFSDEQMKYVSVDETDYTFNALMFDVLENVMVAIDNAPTIETKG